MMFRGMRLGSLTVMGKLNRGTESQVWLVEDKFGKKFAVKDYVNFPSRYRKNEVMMHRKLGKHENISSPLDDAFHVKKNASVHNILPNSLVFKYYKRGDLADYHDVTQGEDIEYQLLDFMTGLWKGLAHCHANDITHRDIKPQNILYDDVRNTVLLTDFGMSHSAIKMTSAGTSFYYSAPECFGRMKHPPYNYKCDIWSAGVTYLTMLSGTYILEENHGHNIRLRGHKYLEKNFSYNWNKLSDVSKMILTSTLKPNPHDRCEAEDIVKVLA